MTDWRKAFQLANPNLDCKLNWSLKQQTYFKVGGEAEIFVQIDNLADLQATVQYCYRQAIKLTILGGASNVIVADAGVSGVVVQLINQAFEVSGTIVRVGAGEKTALLVRKTVDAGLTGLEYFLGVPGTVGGAILNNAHYLSQLISQYVIRVQVVTPSGEVLWLSKAQADFGYDHSRFQTSGEIIWQVEFDLPRGDKIESQKLIKSATEYRAKTQPLGLPSSGCIFQNVPNNAKLKQLFPQFADKEFVPGGFLIDQAGLKGTKVGDIEVSEKHAAFMINRGQGTQRDLNQLIEMVKTQVKLKFGVELREEVFYIR